ncbi:hypothetical protein BJY16_001664 [Actinoplanes octamycinicus]|uniref:Uncharacterized protein n=1 Tax=Actinoplanes octamycinicus TaxID=135948 RepID=A0A7W7GTV1_9ACTN|nr:hypothetical protein [Actinoplanes octamycinicus]
MAPPDGANPFAPPGSPAIPGNGPSFPPPAPSFPPGPGFGAEEPTFPPPSSSFPGGPATPNPFGAPQGAPAWGDFAGGAPAAPPGADHFNEHTTDVSGRGKSPFVPAPALPPMPGSDPFGNGPGSPMQGSDPFGNGPGPQATVTPPSPEDTTSWPGPADQGKFDQFKAEEPPAPAKPKVKTGPVALFVVLGAALLLAVVFGLTWLISSGGDDSDFKLGQGECVKNGEKVVKVACTEQGAYQVTQIADAKDQCADKAQPVIVAGKKVYCLAKPTAN